MNTTSRFKTLLGKAVIYCIFAACAVIVILYTIQYFGAKYADEKLQEQLTYSGLTSQVHYEKVYFDPFTLTPSFEKVRIGNESAPWLRFARISFNSYPLTYPNVDIDFWIEESAITEVSRDTGRIMQAAGIETLLGKGKFSSHTEGQQVSTAFQLHIKDVGKLSFSSYINLLNDTLNVPEIRSDLLASFALGQPEAILSIYGDDIALGTLSLRYEEAGLVNHVFPAKPLSERAQQAQKNAFTFGSQVLGLAKANSNNAAHIAETLTKFLAQPESITLSIEPSNPVTLKQLVRSAREDALYSRSQMTLSIP
ncbi:hypothetical protein [Marinomonas sp. IMCC 4694]|uniref:hypothetical protein n=1 Tax=Marinomonas sp. IMCC 4694 TaxID=2605432 RepID=UPI0011E7E815|nr:hypothetical protein [Marinomonas sp. IMCC 4694]TYL48730.1 hypothetical protein FXV75_12840 [Marinomonas sp. IMCC 4694]